MSDAYDFPVCSECGLGHYRYRQHGALTCTVCEKQVNMSDFEDVFYNPQWDVLVTTPDLSREVIHEVREALGIELSPWHTGGGCMALGAQLPDGREVMVTDGEVGLPGCHNSDALLGGVFDPEDPDAFESVHYEGRSLVELVDRLRGLL